jgi:histone acetyltransferase (RNA polymerase elongator complex component)
MTRTRRPFIIPVFLPNIGCSNRCVFCNQSEITGVNNKIPSSETLRLLIQKFLGYKRETRGTVQVSFYGGNFLGLKKAHIITLLKEAARFVDQGSVDSLRFSTRPDTINRESLDIISGFPVSTIEIGAQSMDDKVLSQSKRGHTAKDTEQAVKLLKKCNYEIGLQMMIGLPGDNEQRALESGRQVAGLFPDFIRIYPTLVLNNSLLEKWYEDGKYLPLQLDQAISLVKKLYLLFYHHNIRVIRMGLQASENLQQGSTVLAGPYHPSFGHLVLSEIFLDLAISTMESKKTFGNSINIQVHPKNVSKIRGLKNKNVFELKNRFHIKTINILPDPSLEEMNLLIT